jgi:hypothetical protein
LVGELEPLVQKLLMLWVGWRVVDQPLVVVATE